MLFSHKVEIKSVAIFNKKNSGTFFLLFYTMDLMKFPDNNKDIQYKIIFFLFF